jgi:glycosyltransferase involved in cell wall biosynthesis
MSAAAEVSVVIATVDRPATLARCLDALLAGSLLPGEIVVVDQGSNDATTIAIAERTDKLVPLVHIRQDRRGLSASRNLGVSRSKCRVVAITDDDCVPDREWVAVIDRTFRAESPPDALTGRILPLGPPMDGTYVVSARTGTRRTVYTGNVVPWDVGSGANIAMTRECFITVGGCNERLGAGSPGRAAEDIDLIYRLLRLGLRITYEPDAVVFHERQSRHQRITSRYGYGFGIGAFCAMWLRRGDRYPGRVLWKWLKGQTLALALAAARGRWFDVYQRWLSVKGTLGGVIYGVRLGDARHAPPQLITDRRHPS